MAQASDKFELLQFREPKFCCQYYFLEYSKYVSKSVLGKNKWKTVTNTGEDSGKQFCLIYLKNDQNITKVK